MYDCNVSVAIVNLNVVGELACVHRICVPRINVLVIKFNIRRVNSLVGVASSNPTWGVDVSLS